MMGRNPMTNFNLTLRCINSYEEWRIEPNGTWRKYGIRQFTDGSATARTLSNPITEQEYFKLKLGGDV